MKSTPRLTPTPKSSAQFVTQPVALFMAMVLLLSACGASTVAPSVSITAPANGAAFNVGDTINVDGKGAGTNTKSVALYINDIPYGRVNQRNGDEIPFLAPWVPDAGGQYILVLKAEDDKGIAILQSDPVIIQVNGPAAQPEPTQPPPPTAPPAPAVAAPTAVPVAPAQSISATTATTTTGDAAAPAVPAAPAAPAASGSASVVPLGDFANVRKGPGLVYETVGQIQANQTIPVKGKNSDGTWFQVSFPAAPGGLGWVFKDVVTFSGDASKLTVAQAPEPPVQAAAPVVAAPVVNQEIVPLTAPTSAAPAPTPVPAAAVEPYNQGAGVTFEPRNGLDYDALRLAESTTAKWGIAGATKAEIEIVGSSPPSIYDCPAGNTGAVSPSGARQQVSLPTGGFPFSINQKGYYLVTLYVTKADGSQTTIPRGIAVDCYKKPGT